MLIALSGLPAAGKTTIGRRVARELGAAYVRVDTIEAAIAASGISSVGTIGYVVGYAVAADQLRAGRSVVADSVNPVQQTREAWRDVAVSTQSDLLEVEIVCSDTAEHRHRVESRSVDGAAVHRPTWDDVLHRGYEPWTSDRLVVDTAGRTVEEGVALIVRAVREACCPGRLGSRGAWTIDTSATAD